MANLNSTATTYCSVKWVAKAITMPSTNNNQSPLMKKELRKVI